MAPACFHFNRRWRNCSDFDGIRFLNRRGFTLIETLVAFMVMAIVLVVILQVFSGGIRSGHKSNQYLYGTFHARAKMEELMTSAINPGSYSGAFDDGYQWQAEVAVVPDIQAPDTDVGVEQMAISVRVSWKENGSDGGIELHSLKLVPGGE